MGRKRHYESHNNEFWMCDSDERVYWVFCIFLRAIKSESCQSTENSDEHHRWHWHGLLCCAESAWNRFKAHRLVDGDSSHSFVNKATPERSIKYFSNLFVINRDEHKRSMSKDEWSRPYPHSPSVNKPPKCPNTFPFPECFTSCDRRLIFHQIISTDITSFISFYGLKTRKR